MGLEDAPAPTRDPAPWEVPTPPLPAGGMSSESPPWLRGPPLKQEGRLQGNSGGEQGGRAGEPHCQTWPPPLLPGAE